MTTSCGWCGDEITEDEAYIGVTRFPGRSEIQGGANTEPLTQYHDGECYDEARVHGWMQ